MTPIIEGKELRKDFQVKTGAFEKPRLLRALAGVSISIQQGESVGLAGESGCGKSTVGKILVNLLKADGGTLAYRGKDAGRLNRSEEAAFRKDVQMIFQDPYSSLNPRMRAGEIIGEPLKIHGLSTSDSYRNDVLRLMAKVGLSEEQYDRYPHEFSGGQRQRIGIARALAVSPRLIVADEPVSALDLSIQAQIINLLQQLKEELSLSFLIIAHDLSVIRHMCDRVMVMYLGKIVESGSRDDIFSGHLHPYTEALISAMPKIGSEPGRQRIILKGDLPSPLAPPSGCPFHTRCPYAEAPTCMEITPPLEEKERGHLAACHFSRKLFR